MSRPSFREWRVPRERLYVFDTTLRDGEHEHERRERDEHVEHAHDERVGDAAAAHIALIPMRATRHAADSSDSEGCSPEVTAQERHDRKSGCRRIGRIGGISTIGIGQPDGLVKLCGR